MSGAGINPLAIYDPATYAQQIAIQRRQALAQSLLQQGEQDPGHAAYGGLRNAGNSILGAFLAKRADQQLGNLYNPQANATPQGQAQQGGVDPGQLSNSSGSGPIMSAPQGGAAPSQPPSPQPQGQQSGRGFSPGNNPPDYALLPPQAKRIYDQIPHIPGMPAQQALNYFLTNPQGYQAEWAKMFEQTPEQKNAAFVSPGDPNAQRTAIGGILTKSGTVTGRAGNALIGPDGKTNYVPPQAPPGYTYIQGQDGKPYLVQIGGGMSAVANSAFAQQAPKALLTPQTQYGPDNLPVNSNALASSGNAGAASQLGIGPQAQMPGNSPLIPQANPGAMRTVESGNNPNAVSPMGAQGPAQTMPGTNAQPGFGVQPAQNGTPQEQGRVGDDYLGAMMQKYQNPVLAHVAYNMGPGRTDQWLAAGGDFSKLPDETQKYLGRIAVAQAMQGRQQAPAPQQPLRPELPQGQATYMQGQAKDAAERHDGTVAAAAESPMRINVLDNIINLSKQGVATGPGQDWQNQVLGYAANVPGLSKIMGPAKDNVAKFQELQKFTYQNAIRSWQAAGGTGTDAQMQSMAHANPNDHLFPQALQGIAQWGKAAELAVQAKANAQDAYLSQNGQTPQAQIKFESTWRNAFEPKVFQYQLMSPQEKQQFAAQQLRTPQAAKEFLAKQQQLKAIGALQ